MLPTYIAGMIPATPILSGLPDLPDLRDQRRGREAGSPALLPCLGLAVALLAACSKPGPAAPVQPAPVAQASSAVVTAASTPATPAEPTTASAPAPGLKADAPVPAVDTKASAPGAALPQAIVAFQKQRDACDHFRSEEPYDKQRAAFLKAQLAKTCKGSDRALAALRKRFAHHPDALAALQGYEGQIE